MGLTQIFISYATHFPFLQVYLRAGKELFELS